MHETELNPFLGPIPIESVDKDSSTETINFFNLLKGKRISEFNLIHFKVNPLCKSKPDQHQSKEYWFIMSGEGRLEVNGKSQKIHPGEVHFFDSMVTHEVWNTSNSNQLQIFSIWW